MSPRWPVIMAIGRFLCASTSYLCTMTRVSVKEGISYCNNEQCDENHEAGVFHTTFKQLRNPKSVLFHNFPHVFSLYRITVIAHSSGITRYVCRRVLEVMKSKNADDVG